MSLIHVDNLLTEQKSKQNKQKDKQNTEKKLNRKVKFKISKYGFKKPTPTPMKRTQEEQPELNNCIEWKDCAKQIIIKLLSLPAMSDKTEFEELIKNSSDMNSCIEQIPLFKFSTLLPYWVASALTYASLYMKVKTNKLAKISNVKYDKVEKTEPKSMLNFTVIKPEI